MAALNKIVVLGANSFSGQDFVDLLLAETAAEVIGVSRSKERSDLFLRYRLRDDLSRYRYFQYDMNERMDDLLELLDAEQPQAIVNFAAQSEVAPSWENPHHWFHTNCASFARLLQHLSRVDYLERYLHISSPEVYGTCEGTVREDAPLNPSTPYAVSKAAADLLLAAYRKQCRFPVLSVRATNVYGARQQLFKIIPRTVIYLRQDRTISLHGGGVAVKSYIHIRDVSRGELAVLNEGRPGEMYHLSPAGGVAVKDVVQTICARMDRDFQAATEVVGERPGQDAAYVIDSAKARTELGWQPKIGLEEGFDEVIEWVDRYWNMIEAQPLEYIHKR